MKRFLTGIAVFFAVVSVVDVCCGFGFDYLRSRAKGGGTQKNKYIADVCEDDILILGSSRAFRHYVPSIMEDSLGLSCYNAGEGGCGIIPAYARYRMVAERHKPKLVIYEVTPQYDYLEYEDYSRYLGKLRQDFDKEAVKEMYSAFGAELDGIRILSEMYVNNSKLLYNLQDWFSFPYDKGFAPLHGVMTEQNVEKTDERNVKKPSSQEATETNNPTIDSLMLFYFEKLIVAAKEDNVPLVLAVSPVFNKMSEDMFNQYSTAMELSRKYSVDFINCADMEGIDGVREMFHDSYHMNDRGATTYTRKFASLIKRSGVLPAAVE